MKRILLLSLLATSGFSQTAEWIYYNKNGIWPDGNSVYRIKPDGTENELIMDNNQISDISEDGLKILLHIPTSSDPILLIDLESMDTITVDNGGDNPRFTYDENVIIYYKDMNVDSGGNHFYKYSFIDSSETLIADSVEGFDVKMSPDKQKFVFFQTNQDSTDVVIADIQSGQTSTLVTVLPPGAPFISLFESYWGPDDYIYLNLRDGNGVIQLFRIHSSNGDASLIQLTEQNEDCRPLASNDIHLEKLAFISINQVTGPTGECWLYDFESNETLYLGDIDSSSWSVHQTWSPDNSKIAIGEIWATGIWTPGPIKIFDTATDSFTTLVDSTWPPCFWVGDTGGQDCTADDGTDGVELWGECYSVENTTELDLSYIGVTGEIPTEIGNLINLSSLILKENQLSGEIPPEISSLMNLAQLDLGGNQLSGEIPPEIGSLTNLNILDLAGNQLTGTLPPEIGNLENLTELELGGNQVMGAIPLEIGNLESLTFLHLEYNQFTGEIPVEIGNLTNLVWLNFVHNQLTGEIPSNICNMDMNWSDPNNFNISENQLCPPYPECIEEYVGDQDTTNCVQVSILDETFPLIYRLHSAYPNPFNLVTTLNYDLPENELVNITIYDMMGRVVNTLINDQQTAGYKSIQWNATNNTGQSVSTGLYLYTIEAGKFRQTKKMVLMK